MGEVSLDLLRKEREKLFKKFKRSKGDASSKLYMKLLTIDLRIGELTKKYRYGGLVSLNQMTQPIGYR